MATIYSTELLARKGLSGEVVLTVPAGFVVIMRDLDVYYGGGFGSCTVYLHGSAGQAIWFNSFPPGGGQYASWRGRQVIGPGETYGTLCSNPADVTLSGYVLTAP